MSTERIILEAIGQQYAMGNREPEKKKLVYSKDLSAKTIANNFPKLKNKGLIEYDSKTVRLTKKGMELIGPESLKPPNPEELIERIKEGLKGKQIELFNMLLDGEKYDKDTVAKDLGYENGKKTKAFANLAGVMKNTKGLVIYPDKDTIQINREKVYPYGLP